MTVRPTERVFVIAEAGVNHNGSFDLARKLIDAAADAGADAVKFQTFHTGDVVTRSAPKAEYQLSTTDNSESQYEMISALELDEEAHRGLAEHCAEVAVQFLSSPFDLRSVLFLANTLCVSTIKLGSGELTNAPLLLAAARTGKPLVVSTGMATLGEVECALGVLAFGYLGGMEPPSPQRFEAAYASEAGRRQLETKVALLHCTTEYPAPFDEVNLRSMKTLHKAFGLSTGLSDHTAGIAIPIAAVALGARVIEKHFTLDSGLTGPDHKASLEPGELKAMVRSIREVESALGSPIKAPSPCELKNRELVRKSLVALRTIRKGEVFTAENLGVKRPGAGIPPARYWEFLGRQAVRDYKEDDFVVE